MKTKTKTRINFSEIVLKDIDGAVIKDCEFHKTVANTLYHQAKTVDFIDIAIAINRGETVELTDAQIEEIHRCIFLERSHIAAHARKSFQDFIE